MGDNWVKDRKEWVAGTIAPSHALAPSSFTFTGLPTAVTRRRITARRTLVQVDVLIRYLSQFTSIK